eukprot:GHVU01148757.1.p1 GENE.GHVU01148757.1~~GHVU01148757.1.p1  ORF type:complete len:153 (+),score=7.57 GHVU01148757.1:166-624(+)
MSGGEDRMRDDNRKQEDSKVRVNSGWAARMQTGRQAGYTRIESITAAYLPVGQRRTYVGVAGAALWNTNASWSSNTAASHSRRPSAEAAETIVKSGPHTLNAYTHTHVHTHVHTHTHTHTYTRTHTHVHTRTHVDTRTHTNQCVTAEPRAEG